MITLGALCFALVIGWTAHYVLIRTKKINIGSISSFVAAVGGGGVIRLFGEQPRLFAVYSIGLALSYFARAFFTHPRVTDWIMNEAFSKKNESV